MTISRLWFIAVLLVSSWTAASAQTTEASYFHPPVTSQENYPSIARVLPEANRAARLELINSIELRLLERPFPARLTVFTAGDDADELIVSVNSSMEMDTVYRARTLMQGFTAVARTLPFMQQNAVDDVFSFLDVAKLAGFTTVMVTNGKDFTHRFDID